MEAGINSGGSNVKLYSEAKADVSVLSQFELVQACNGWNTLL